MRFGLLSALALCAPLAAGAAKYQPPANPLPKAQQPALVRHELGKMSERQAGRDSNGLHKFIANRDLLKSKRFARFTELAAKHMAQIPATLRNPNHAEADALFEDMKKDNIGTHIPDDFCYARAELAVQAARRAGFAVRKVNFVAADGTMLKVKTKNTLTGIEEWNYHVAAVVTVDGVDYVIDPSLATGKITVAQWEAKMNNPKGKTVITDAEYWSYESAKPADVQGQVGQYAESLWIIAGVREYQQFRAMDLRMKK